MNILFTTDYINTITSRMNLNMHALWIEMLEIFELCQVEIFKFEQCVMNIIITVLKNTKYVLSKIIRLEKLKY